MPEKPDPRVLEKRPLHYVMVLISTPDRFSPLLNWLLLALLLSLHYLFWDSLRPSAALLATLILGLAMSGDLLLLWLLPRRKVSFGPIPSQFIAMGLPRLGASILALLLALWQPAAGLTLSLVLQLLGTAAYLWGMLVEPHRLALTRLEISSPHLPADAPPIRLLHLSDFHVERLTRRENQVLTLIEEIQPDLIAITGDYLNLSYARDPEAAAQVRSLLAKIDAPYGVYATLGSPPVDVPEVASIHFENSHIRLLREDLVEVDLSEGRRITVLGLDCTHDMPYDSARLTDLNARRNGRQATILLYHSPELMPYAQHQGIDLFLCGHTHGGQVRLPFYGAILTSTITGKRYEMGRYDENGTTLYVSRGIGLEGLSAPRLRLFCPPEITLVTLTGQAEG